jgi:hypothetical protein
MNQFPIFPILKAADITGTLQRIDHSGDRQPAAIYTNSQLPQIAFDSDSE